MPFRKIEDALTTCQNLLSAISAQRPENPNAAEIESYIVSSMVVLIVSEYEDLIEQLFIERSLLCKDGHICNYIKLSVAQKFRSPDLGKITDFLGKFGSDYKDGFSRSILNSEFHSAWDNIMKARHAVVHKKGNLNMTFRELIEAYPKTKHVITQIRGTLGL